MKLIQQHIWGRVAVAVFMLGVLAAINLVRLILHKPGLTLGSDLRGVALVNWLGFALLGAGALYVLALLARGLWRAVRGAFSGH